MVWRSYHPLFICLNTPDPHLKGHSAFKKAFFFHLSTGNEGRRQGLSGAIEPSRSADE